MITRALLALSLALPALAVPTAAPAESVFDTHREVSMPSGKTIKLYRPITRQDCKAAPERADKPSSADRACAKLVANDAAPAAKLAAR